LIFSLCNHLRQIILAILPHVPNWHFSTTTWSSIFIELSNEQTTLSPIKFNFTLLFHHKSTKVISFAHCLSIQMNGDASVQTGTMTELRDDPSSQFSYGLRLAEGNGIPPNPSLAAHYFKLAADQGHSRAQLHYGIFLSEGRGIPMNHSLAAHYFKLSADQGNPSAQFNYAHCFMEGKGIPMNYSLAAHYFKLSADQGNPNAQFNYALFLMEGQSIPMNYSLAAYYFKLAADQGVVQEQAAYAESLRAVANGLSRLSDDVLRQADAPFVLLAESRGDDSRRVVGLLSGEFGTIDFQSAGAVVRPGVAAELCAAARSGRCLVLGREFRSGLSCFSILWEGGLLLVRAMIRRLRPRWLSDTRCLAVWRSSAQNASAFLGRHPGFETIADTFANFSKNGSVSDIVREFVRSLFLSSSAFASANSVLERLPMASVARFESEFRGLLSYTTMLQAAVEVLVDNCACSETVVYRALSEDGFDRPLESVVGEVIAWPGFIIGVRTINEAVEAAGSPGSIVLVLRIVVTQDAVAAEIGRFSENEGVWQILIAAESLFRVDSVGKVNISQRTVPEVRLLYAGKWSDRDLDLDFPSVEALTAVRR
jgi:hypothetical protein